MLGTHQSTPFGTKVGAPAGVTRKEGHEAVQFFFSRTRRVRCGAVLVIFFYFSVFFIAGRVEPPVALLLDRQQQVASLSNDECLSIDEPCRVETL